jgi:hypothetical protein
MQSKPPSAWRSIEGGYFHQLLLNYFVCSKGLIPEMESSARLTLCHPLTFESLGDALRSFKGRALRDLADFHMLRMRDFTSNSGTFFKSFEGPSHIWTGCPTIAGWNHIP